MKLIRILLITGIIAFALLPFSSKAQFNPGSYNHCLEISANNIILTGSFNGSSYFDASDFTILVPKMKPGIGFGIEYGIVALNGGSFDFAYRYSTCEYTTMYNDISGKTTTHVWQVLGGNAHFQKFSDKRLKPYIHFDLAFTFNRFDNVAYFKENPTELYSARFAGFSVDVGPGLQYMLSPSLALDLRIVPGYHSKAGLKSKVKPKDINMEADELFGNFLLISTFGLRYYFIKR